MRASGDGYPSGRIRPALCALGVLTAFLCAAAADAATLTITRAEWRRGDAELRVEGRGAPRRATVTVVSAATGLPVGSVRAEEDGRWKLRVRRPSPVPCRVRAETGSLRAERGVKNAPATCDRTDQAGAGSLQFSAAAYSVTEGAGSATISVSRTGGSSGTVSVAFTVTGGSAAAGQDFEPTSGTLTFQPGDAAPKRFTVRILNDPVSEGPETILLALSEPQGGATLGEPASATLTIQDDDLATSHAGRFATYEGSKTCGQCHAAEVSQVHASLHYQWKGPTPFVSGSGGVHQGKLGSINDFCSYPDINFIGQLVNIDGQVVDGGCAQCHVGLGKKPEPTATPAQLENIDCLVCHSDSYRRKVERQTDGTFRFVPAPERMAVPLQQAITDIRQTPSVRTCVQCHAYAGGGCNNKRGDIESAHINPPRSFDVHMASTQAGGAGLHCLSCHVVEEHRVAGRGTDLRATDLNVRVACTNCHAASPHGDSRLDRHTAKVDCATCHIPAFARITSTDMLRDFSLPADINQTNRLYEAHIDREANVVPEYRFFNGFSSFYDFGTPAVPGPGGRVLMAGPLGDVQDPTAKLIPTKHHRAVQARDAESRVLIPLKMGILFQTGDIDRAIRQGATEAGIALRSGYDFVPTERFMGIFHEVAPAGDALQCAACHDGGGLDSGRVKFAQLGYTPLPQRDPRLGTCSIGCHSNKAGEWGPSELFLKLHDKHVRDKRIDCSTCHAFTRAQGG